jgi:hypothetical protein
MALMSPGIEVKEIDLSIIVPKLSAVVGAFAGIFEKGPVGKEVLITSVAEFIEIFGKPNNSNANDWYQVYSFLQYANKIYVSRAIPTLDTRNAIFELADDGLLNPTLTVEANAASFPVVYNSEDYEIKETSIIAEAGTSIKFIAKDVGFFGNGIEIAVAKASDFTSGTTLAFPGIKLNDLFDKVPSSSEVAIVIRVGGTIKETFIVSMTQGAKDYQNKSTYIEDVLDRRSQYVYAKATSENLPNSALGVNSITLFGGSEGTYDVGDITSALGSISDASIFGNKENLDIDLIIANELARSECGQLASDRADCICFTGPLFEDVVGVNSTTAVSNIITDINGFSGGLTTSFSAYFGNYIQIYDVYNDQYRWISPAGLCAGLRADVSTKRAEWFASAGETWGKVKLAKKLAYIPSQGQRDYAA